MTATIAEKIQDLKDKNLANLKTGPNEVSQQEADNLHTAWLNAETVANSAPGDAAAAKTAYYTYIDGSTEYNSTLTAQYTEEAEELKTKLAKKYEDKAAVVNKNLAYYKSQLSYTENVDTIKSDLLDKIEKTSYEVYAINSDRSTNNRKTFYLNQQTNSFNHWNKLFLAMYIAFGVLCIDQMRQTKKYKIYAPMLVILIFYMTPWFQSIIFAMISSTQSTANLSDNNVYTEWREEAADTVSKCGPPHTYSTGGGTVYDPNESGTCTYANSDWDPTIVQTCTTADACTGFCDSRSGDNYGTMCTTDNAQLVCGEASYCVGTNNQGSCDLDTYPYNTGNCSYTNSEWDNTASQSCVSNANCTGFCDSRAGDNYGDVCTPDNAENVCGDYSYCIGTNDQGSCNSDTS